MTTAILLSINRLEVTGTIFTVAWLLVTAIVLFLDHGIRHGWFIPSDEAVREYRERILRERAEKKG